METHPSTQPDRRSTSGRLGRITKGLENIAGDIRSGRSDEYHALILERIIDELSELQARDLFAYQQQQLTAACESVG